jgi:hypothetical protein
LRPVPEGVAGVSYQTPTTSMSTSAFDSYLQQLLLEQVAICTPDLRTSLSLNGTVLELAINNIKSNTIYNEEKKRKKRKEKR